MSRRCTKVRGVVLRRAERNWTGSDPGEEVFLVTFTDEKPAQAFRYFSLTNEGRG